MEDGWLPVTDRTCSHGVLLHRRRCRRCPSLERILERLDPRTTSRVAHAVYSSPARQPAPASGCRARGVCLVIRPGRGSQPHGRLSHPHVCLLSSGCVSFLHAVPNIWKVLLLVSPALRKEELWVYLRSMLPHSPPGAQRVGFFALQS